MGILSHFSLEVRCLQVKDAPIILESTMIFRADKLLPGSPIPRSPDANAAAAAQELMVAKAGELSTLMNHFIQTNNYRGRKVPEPFFDLISNIAAEVMGHAELMHYAIHLLLTGTRERGGFPPSTHFTHHFGDLREFDTARASYREDGRGP